MRYCGDTKAKQQTRSLQNKVLAGWGFDCSMGQRMQSRLMDAAWWASGERREVVPRNRFVRKRETLGGVCNTVEEALHIPVCKAPARYESGQAQMYESIKQPISGIELKSAAEEWIVWHAWFKDAQLLSFTYKVRALSPIQWGCLLKVLDIILLYMAQNEPKRRVYASITGSRIYMRF